MELELLRQCQSYIQDLGKVDNLTIDTQIITPNQVMTGIFGTVEVRLPLAGLVDVSALRERLTKKLQKIEMEVQSLEKRLHNPQFIAKADPDVVQGARTALAEAEIQATILRERIIQSH